LGRFVGAKIAGCISETLLSVKTEVTINHEWRS